MRFAGTVLHGWCRMSAINLLEPKDILTPQELSKRLKVPLSWIYEKSRGRGQFSDAPFPVLHCGKYLRFEWPAVVEWLRLTGGK